jgi:hypothetical protein
MISLDVLIYAIGAANRILGNLDRDTQWPFYVLCKV